MKLIGAPGQILRHPFWDASGTITAGGTAQLVLPQRQSCSFLKLQNLSNGPLWFEFGSARAHATLTSGIITALTVDNAGFGFTLPPVVEFLGGGNFEGNTAFVGATCAGYPTPNNPGHVRAVLTGNAVSSFVIDDGGSGYLVPPYVYIRNSNRDPNGCALPSAISGMLISPQDPPYILNGTCCTTDPVAVFGATTGQQFLCKWMD
jgi:hypothetical protein